MSLTIQDICKYPNAAIKEFKLVSFKSITKGGDIARFTITKSSDVVIIIKRILLNNPDDYIKEYDIVRIFKNKMLVENSYMIKETSFFRIAEILKKYFIN